jgi:hypothetical protein
MTVPAGSSTEPVDTDELPLVPAGTAAAGGPVTAPPADSTAASVHGGLMHPISLLVAAVTGGALAYAFDTSSRASVIAVALVQAVLIVAWVFGGAASGRVGAVVLGAGAAVASDIVVTHAHNEVGSLVAVLGLSVVALFGHQLLRGRRREHVVESLSHTALLLVAVTALATTLELRHQVDGPALTTAVWLSATAALVAGHLVDWVWSPLRFDPTVSRGLPAVVVSVGAGAVVSAARLQHSVEFTGQRAALLGASLAAVTALFAVGAAYVRLSATLDGVTQGGSTRLLRLLAAVSGPLFVFAFMSPPAYLLCLALRG